MSKSRSARSRPRRTPDLKRKETDLRLRLETWAVSVTFLALMTVIISQAISYGR